MPRPKEFDRESALKGAVQVFCEGGFEGTSTEDLLRGMGISRQSMYDTFGDKRALYLEALRHYVTERVARVLESWKLMWMNQVFSSGFFLREVVG